MDKDLLRIVIIATGAVVIIGMLVWSFISSQKEAKQDFDFEGDESIDDEFDEPLLESSPEMFVADVKIETATTEDEDIAPLFKEIPEGEGGLVGDDLLSLEEEPGPVLEEPVVKPKPKPKKKPKFKNKPKPEPKPIEVPEVKIPDEPNLPEVIQFRIMAHNREGFNGLDMLQAFSSAELQYGNLGIFERLDTNRQVDFGVASMVGSGIFPAKEEELEAFFSPGLIFFMQPKVLDNALDVFDDFIDTVQMLALQLGGFECDGNGQPLTAEGVFQLRAKLES